MAPLSIGPQSPLLGFCIQMAKEEEQCMEGCMKVSEARPGSSSVPSFSPGPVHKSSFMGALQAMLGAVRCV